MQTRAGEGSRSRPLRTRASSTSVSRTASAEQTPTAVRTRRCAGFRIPSAPSAISPTAISTVIPSASGPACGDPEPISRTSRAPGACPRSLAASASPTDRASLVSVSPLCELDSAGVITKCHGSNKCSATYFALLPSGEAYSLGACWGACEVDADCKGTPGSKCQSEKGECVRPDRYVAYAKLPGQGRDASATPAECNCSTVGGTGRARTSVTAR